MNQDHHERRRTAAQEFIQSLGELEHMLRADTPEPPRHASVPTPAPEETAMNWENALDEAVADIEHYMEKPPSDFT